ncbi:hypothetical protein [Asticcacaulis sp. 201]|uniref:hypothetical protein n=1 Tax=Asticcacaulis sp. 201 TaxID=3028787 RepID=UPI0029165FD8|nr:hypothetical protein [Asticcacaulis sp. 201]MDV6330754.1 hypothetical protein [Asticcacaulis sp. 201]
MGSLLPDSVDVAAGIVFVYLLMSLLTTVVREAIEGFCKSRATNLEKGLIELLCDHPPEHPANTGAKGSSKASAYDMLKTFYDHPLTMTLYRGRYQTPDKRGFLGAGNLPSYIPSSHFAFVVLDMLAERGGQAEDGRLDSNAILAATKGLPNTRLAKMVSFAINNSGGDLDKARSFMENWYNATMDRVSGWYRRETQTIIFWLSLVICVILNVNTVVIAQSLYLSPSLRKAVEASSQEYYSQHVNADPSNLMPANGTNPLAALDLPLGWNDTTLNTMNHLFQFCGEKNTKKCPPVTPVGTPMPDWSHARPDQWMAYLGQSVKNISEHATHLYQGNPSLGDHTLFNILPLISLIMGWLMTAFAVTLGAPFWFDVLSKLMTVRSTLKPKDGGGGVSGFDGLSAITAAFSAPQVTETTAQLTYQPSLVASSAPAATPHDDADMAFLAGLDPTMRPRDN